MNDNLFDHPLKTGLRHSEQLVVAPLHTVPEIDDAWPGFRDMPPVFATAMMIGFIEQTCVQALRPYLAAEQRTVGTHVDVSHVAATPVGMTITTGVELVAVEEESSAFEFNAWIKRVLLEKGHTKGQSSISTSSGSA